MRRFAVCGNDDTALKGGASLIPWYEGKVPIRWLFTAQKTTLTRIISDIQGQIGRVRRFESKAKVYQQSEARGHTGKRTVATAPGFATNVVHGVQSPPHAPILVRVAESRRFWGGLSSSTTCLRCWARCEARGEDACNRQGAHRIPPSVLQPRTHPSPGP